MRYKTPTRNSEFYLPAEDYRCAVHWCLRYPGWLAELAIEPDTSKAITYDKERVQTSSNFNPVETLAIRRAELQEKKDLLERTVKEVDESIYSFLLLAVTRGLTFRQLEARGIPCSINYFTKKRQEVYYKIAKQI